MEISLEQSLLEEVLKALKERQKNEEEYVCSGIILDRDDYAQRVGYMRAIKEITLDFQQIHKTFFPEFHQR